MLRSPAATSERATRRSRSWSAATRRRSQRSSRSCGSWAPTSFCRAAPAPGSTPRWRTRSPSPARCWRPSSRSPTRRRAGLDTRRVLQSIGAGSAASWSLANLAPRILDGDFAPGFYVKHFVKDMRIALESAAEMGLDAARASRPPSGSTTFSRPVAVRISARRRCGFSTPTRRHAVREGIDRSARASSAAEA